MRQTIFRRLGAKDRRAGIWLGVITILTHFHWIFDFSIFTSGDWQFVGQEQYRSFVNFSPIWVSSGFGGTSATPGFYLIRFLEGLLTLVGSSFVFNEKLFFFLPIAFVGTFGTYIFLRQYFKEWPAFIGAMVFAFNTALLFNYAGALTIAVADAFTPLALYFFRQYMIRPKDTKLLCATSLVFAVMAVYELRITLLAVGLAAGLFVFNVLVKPDGMHYVKERLWPLTKLGLVIFGLQAFWLLPYVVGSRAGVTFSNLLGQGLFVSFSTIENALTLYHPFWTGARPATFVVQSIPLFAWLIPIAAFGGFAFRRRRINPEIGYWAFVALCGIFLVKQGNIPLVGAYPWLFAHIPGFAAFRDASKFYLYIAIGYAVLIPFTLSNLQVWLREQSPKRLFSSRYASILFTVISGGFLCVLLINTAPLLTGTFRTTYIPRHMPSDYVTLNKFIDAQPAYFRLLWVPVNSRWGVQSNLHPTISAVSIDQGTWLEDLSTVGLNPDATLRDKSVNIFSQASSPAMLNAASIKYVIVPIRDTANEDDFFVDYGDDRQYYITALNHLSYLQRINIGTKSLVVYENKDYEPHISSSTSLTSLHLTADANINAIYKFMTQQLGDSFNFVTRAAATAAYPKTTVDDLFQELTKQDIGKGAVSKTVITGQRPELYINTADQQVRYAISKDVITFYGTPRNDLALNGKLLGPVNPPTSILASRRLSPATQYYLDIGGVVTSISIKSSGQDLGTFTQPIALYAETGDNIVPDSSFEQGLWQKKVADCNDYDDDASMQMLQATGDATNGSHSLEFDVNLHTACTDSANIPVTSSSYLLRLDYQVTGGQTASYEVIFNNPAHTETQQTMVGGTNWRTVASVIHVPNGATTFKIRLFGYPDYTLSHEAATNYDNVRMMPLASLVALTNPAPHYSAVPLASNATLKFVYPNDNTEQGKNILSDGAFQQGLWQKTVSDCDDYDDNPDIGMQLVHSPQGMALQLNAQRHNACTGKSNIPIAQNADYLLNFAYQSPNATQASYSAQFNNANHTSISGTIPIHDQQWHTLTKQIQTPIGATTMTLTVYADGSSGGTADNIDRYTDFSLQELPTVTNQYYLVEGSGVALQQPKHIAFKPEGATKNLVQVTGASTPFYLNMSETYNPLWRLELNNAQSQSFLGKLLPWVRVDAIPDSQHYALDDFENGWYVNPAALCRDNPAGCTREPNGSYDIALVVEFTPQRWFYVGAAISGLTFVGSAGYLLCRHRTRRKAYRAQ
jgi:hypothetical protein